MKFRMPFDLQLIRGWVNYLEILAAESFVMFLFFWGKGGGKEVVWCALDKR